MRIHQLFASRERGAMSAWALIVGAALMVLMMAAYDGSKIARADRQASSLASEAARAAGQELNPSAITGTSGQVDTRRAAVAARQFLASSGATGSVVVRGDRIIITVHQTAQGSLIGTRTMTAEATAEAQRSLGGRSW